MKAQSARECDLLHGREDHKVAVGWLFAAEKIGGGKENVWKREEDKERAKTPEREEPKSAFPT